MDEIDKRIAKIEKFFKKHRISGIISLEGIGTFSLFASEADRLMALDYAKLELEIDRLFRKQEAFEKVEKGLIKKNKIIKTKKINDNTTYIG